MANPDRVTQYTEDVPLIAENALFAPGVLPAWNVAAKVARQFGNQINRAGSIVRDECSRLGINTFFANKSMRNLGRRIDELIAHPDCASVTLSAVVHEEHPRVLLRFPPVPDQTGRDINWRDQMIVTYSKRKDEKTGKEKRAIQMRLVIVNEALDKGFMPLGAAVSFVERQAGTFQVQKVLIGSEQTNYDPAEEFEITPDAFNQMYAALEATYADLVTTQPHIYFRRGQHS